MNATFRGTDEALYGESNWTLPKWHRPSEKMGWIHFSYGRPRLATSTVAGR